MHGWTKRAHREGEMPSQVVRTKEVRVDDSAGGRQERALPPSVVYFHYKVGNTVIC